MCDHEDCPIAEENIRLRRMNKILRTVNHRLRRKRNADALRMDEMFLALCGFDVFDVLEIAADLDQSS